MLVTQSVGHGSALGNEPVTYIAICICQIKPADCLGTVSLVRIPNNGQQRLIVLHTARNTKHES